jgi:hypothetical protein
MVTIGSPSSQANNQEDPEIGEVGPGMNKIRKLKSSLIRVSKPKG